MGQAADLGHAAGDQSLVPTEVIAGQAIGDVTIFLSRGSFSSSQRAKCDFPVLHTTDLSPAVYAVKQRLRYLPWLDTFALLSWSV